MRLTREVTKELFFEALLFVAGAASIALLYRSALLLTGTILATTVVAFGVWYERRDVHFFVMGALIGPLAEIVCAKAGAWTYANPTFLGIPLWLPFAWGLATVLVRKAAGTFEKLEAKSEPPRAG